jgi:hypothetical protein
MENLHANVLLKLSFVPFFSDDPGYSCAELVVTIPLPFLRLLPQGRSGLASVLCSHFPFLYMCAELVMTLPFLFFFTFFSSQLYLLYVGSTLVFDICITDMRRHLRSPYSFRPF